MGVLDRISELGYELPAPSAVAGNYLPVVESAGLVCVSGQLPKRDGVLLYPGKVGEAVDAEQGRDAAVAAALCALAAFYACFADFEIVEQILQLRGFVNAVPDFTEHSSVVDGASDLLVALFGERGRHARAALGVSSLPSNAPLELELMLRISTARKGGVE